MSSEIESINKVGKEIPSFLEKIIEMKFLVLLLTGLLYLDIWILHYNLNPMTWTLASLGENFKSVPIFTVALFVLSYSLLMGFVFPFLRSVITTIRLHLGWGTFRYDGKTSQSDRNFATWSLAFFLLSIFDYIHGVQSDNPYYKGLMEFFVSIAEDVGFEVRLFKLCIAIFWMFCAYVAFQID